ncbi:MAG: hypothetical protein ABSE46_07420 [Terracidiphilus sp.]|jgi:hypothetical protein
MKKYARTLVAIAFLLGLTTAVRAESQDGVIVAMPFEFVVGAKSLPAGTYEVRNSSDDKSSTLVISSRDHGTSIFVLPYVRESVVTDKPELSFQQVGGQYFLSTIQTAATVYRIHVPDASVNETVVKANDGVPASGSHGGR